MKIDRYLGRGIHNEQFLESLRSGKMKPMLEIINKDRDLDVQIRNNYLNIYYDGGNIAKVSSENSIIFNENYFYANKDTPTKNIDNGIKKELKQKRKELINKFKDGDFETYFKEAKEVMDSWFEVNPKEERKEQHQLSIENQYGDSDYTIIDIEYQVSTKSEFVCTYKDKHGKVKKPRFDIIAVNRAGTLCVIELKKGTRALGGVSGLEEHYECYTHSIGRNPGPFMEEMSKLLKQKHEFGLVDKRVKILSFEPKLMFAYSYTTKDKRKEDRTFEKYYEKLQMKTHVIRLNKGNWALKDKPA